MAPCHADWPGPAQRLCPQFSLAVDIKAYAAVSKQVVEILGRFTDFEPFSE